MVAAPTVQSRRHVTVIACVGLVLQVVTPAAVVLPLTWHWTSLASVASTVAFSVVFMIFSMAR